ncbi:hypothetical protein C9374_001510 [Naegleria lovaniensis]|uniref:Uncharacterized protein n=1 Tax=Naegleria lovaniensis TaxID=51637 RepID=A0AA88GWQ4_NAELO|nr:uncharacterized protein C9374_001510 [Naegleria lovaniensis]KAG2387178.1 hypothetical protein C9374_001510 [Naegleria lovaniensis]
MDHLPPSTTVLEDEDSLIIIPTKRHSVPESTSSSSNSSFPSSNPKTTTTKHNHFHHHQPPQQHSMNHSHHHYCNGNENHHHNYNGNEGEVMFGHDGMTTTPTSHQPPHKYDLCSPPVISTRSRSTSSSVVAFPNNNPIQNTTESDNSHEHTRRLHDNTNPSCIENSSCHHQDHHYHTTSDSSSSIALNAFVSSPTSTTCSTLSNSSTSSLTSLLEFQQPPLQSSSSDNILPPPPTQGIIITTDATTSSTCSISTTMTTLQNPLTVHYPQYTIPSLKELFVTRHGEKTSQLIKYGTGLHGFTSPTTPPSSASSAETPSTPIDVNGDYDADPPLTERGQLCAKLFGQNFYLNYLVKKVEQTFTNSQDQVVAQTLQIYTSPFHRCLQTTEQIVKSILEESERDGKMFNIEVYIDFGLMEFYGLKRKWTLDMMPPNVDQIREEFPLLNKFIVDRYCNEELNLEGLHFSLNPENFLAYFTEKNTMELMYDLIRRVRGTFYNVENNVRKIRTENVEPTVLLVTHAATMIRIVEELIGIYHKTPLSERTNVKASICGLSHLKRECTPKEVPQPTIELISSTTTVTTQRSTTAITSSPHLADPLLQQSSLQWSLITNNDISFMEAFESKKSQRSLQYYQIDSSHYVNRK